MKICGCHDVVGYFTKCLFSSCMVMTRCAMAVNLLFRIFLCMVVSNLSRITSQSSYNEKVEVYLSIQQTDGQSLLELPKYCKQSVLV